MKMNDVKAKNDLYTELAKLKKENIYLRKDNKTYEIYFNRIRKLICQDARAVGVGGKELQIMSSDMVDSIGRREVEKTLVLSEARNTLSHLVKSGEDDKLNSQIIYNADSPGTALKCHKSPPPKEQMDNSFRHHSHLSVGPLTTPTPTKHKNCATSLDISIRRPSRQAGMISKGHSNSSFHVSHPSITNFKMTYKDQDFIRTSVSNVRNSLQVQNTPKSTTRRNHQNPNTIIVPQLVTKRVIFRDDESMITSSTLSSTSSNISTPLKIVDKTPDRIPASTRRLNSPTIVELKRSSNLKMENVSILLLNVPVSDNMKRVSFFICVFQLHYEDIEFLFDISSTLDGKYVKSQIHRKSIGSYTCYCRGQSHKKGCKVCSCFECHIKHTKIRVVRRLMQEESPFMCFSIFASQR